MTLAQDTYLPYLAFHWTIYSNKNQWKTQAYPKYTNTQVAINMM